MKNLSKLIHWSALSKWRSLLRSLHMKKFTKLVFTWHQVSGAFPQSNSTRKQFQTKWYQVLRVSRWVSKNLDTILMYKSNKIVSFFLGEMSQIFYCGTKKVATANHSSKSGSNSLGVYCCKVSELILLVSYISSYPITTTRFSLSTDSISTSISNPTSP